MQKKMVEAINKQIQREFFSAYLYLAISNYYVEEHLDGFANWFQVQAREERDHAMLFVRYLQDNDESVKLFDIQAPAASYASVKEPLQVTYAHEQGVTKAIHDMYEQALQEKDYRTLQFLQWFVEEQGEEEKIARELIERVELIGEAKQGGLFWLDNELKSRAYEPPANADD